MSEYELHPSLIAYPATFDGVRAIALDRSSVEPPVLVDDPRLLWAIGVLDQRFTRADALSKWSTEPKCAPVAAEMWAFLVAEELLVPVDRERPDCELARRIYHDPTRSYPFLDMAQPGAVAQDSARMHEYAEMEPAPAPVLVLESDFSVALPALRDVLSLDKPFSSLGALSLLLGGTFGVTERKSIPVRQGGEHSLDLVSKSIPSGGSRHPTECFIDSGGTGWPVLPGRYHYNVSDHALDRIGDVPRGELSLPVPEGSLILHLASQVERSMWRYREPRSFRAVLLDAGHAAGQLEFLAGLAGLRYSHMETREVFPEESTGFGTEHLPVLFAGLVSRC